MRKNDTFVAPSIVPVDTQTASTPADLPPPPRLPDGTVLRYAREDSGGSYPDRGLWLAPGYDYEVGEDLDGEFGFRLVMAGVCRVYNETPAEAEADEAEETEIAPVVKPDPTPPARPTPIAPPPNNQTEPIAKDPGGLPA